MDYKIDWLTLTLKPEKEYYTYEDLKCYGDMCPLEYWLFDFLKLIKIKSDFCLKSGAVQHYNYMYTYSGISIAFANSEKFPQQGLMIRFSAEGIAFYEKYRREYEKDWNFITFLKEFFSLGAYDFKCKCTRIDIAFDDISYDNNRLISLERISKAVQRGEAVTLFRRVPEWNKNEFVNEITHIKERSSKGELLSETIEFGNRKSAIFLRFYDKLKEQIKLKREVDPNIKHWVRMEFELKNNRAMSVCDSLMLLSSEEFGLYFSKVVNRYLRFIKPEGDKKHYYRCKVRKWWRDIVGTVEKAKLTENKSVKNCFHSSMRWLQKSVIPTLWAVLNCINVDEFLSDVRQAGYERQSHKHNQIIKDFISNKKEEHNSGLNIHKDTCEDFEILIRELERVSLTNDMKRQGKKLQEILDMQEAFDSFHTTKTAGMKGKNINEFKNRQMVIFEEMQEIDGIFEAFCAH